MTDQEIDLIAGTDRGNCHGSITFGAGTFYSEDYHDLKTATTIRILFVGVRVRAICVVPGDRDQLAVARMLVKMLGLDIPVGASKPDSRKCSSGGMHYDLLDRFGFPREASHDHT
jgi:hypothetical protein